MRRQGRPARLDTLTAFALPRAVPQRARIGISVSKAVGGAVVRNRVRRRIHGALTDLPAGLQFAGDLVFVARPAAAGAPYGRLAADVGAALERARGEVGKPSR